MAARYRIALHGFSEFERNALSFCLKHAGGRVPAYVQVERIADSDFIVADASHAALDPSIVRGERLRDTLFVGEQPPHNAVAKVGRPLDPERILRALDHIVLQRLAPRRGADAPNVVRPPAASVLDFPLLDMSSAVEETTPGAFRPEPVVHFTDIDSAAAAAARPPPREPPAAPPLPADPLAPPPEPARARPPPPAPAKAAAAAAMTEEERHAAKAAARRKSRAARLAQAGQSAAPLHDVLLVDGTDEPMALESLLEAFGFRVVRAIDFAGAASALETTPLAAAFIDVDVQDEDGEDGFALCSMIKRRLFSLAGEAPPVMLLSRRKVASERVQAKLAGCDGFLTHPIRRGDAARALESCDVALPADQRRSPR
jgi:CheY-like chemotaxis protein